jgi:pimeloyl-ACP methyl ester carboxylesterase
MTPFYFGMGRRRLFGIYQPASVAAGGKSRAVVLCHPWGAEYVHAHRSLRLLAARMSSAGFHTLRFDYFGTGDSSGDAIEADLAGWEGDIETAIEELQDLSGAKCVVLAGMRLGATLAASVAMRRQKDVEALVLWDPVVSGEFYLRGLCVLETANGQPSAKGPASTGGTATEFQVGGFPLTLGMAREIQSLDLSEQIQTTATNTLIVMSERHQGYEMLQRATGHLRDKLLTIEYINDPMPWIERPDDAGIVPVNILNRIVSWLKQ